MLVSKDRDSKLAWYDRKLSGWSLRSGEPKEINGLVGKSVSRNAFEPSASSADQPGEMVEGGGRKARCGTLLASERSKLGIEVLSYLKYSMATLGCCLAVSV